MLGGLLLLCAVCTPTRLAHSIVFSHNLRHLFVLADGVDLALLQLEYHQSYVFFPRNQLLRAFVQSMMQNMLILPQCGSCNYHVAISIAAHFADVSIDSCFPELYAYCFKMTWVEALSKVLHSFFALSELEMSKQLSFSCTGAHVCHQCSCFCWLAYTDILAAGFLNMCLCCILLYSCLPE